jgi:hypothetical protein
VLRWPEHVVDTPAGLSAGQPEAQVHTTGVVRSDSTDDIACWFIDTAYDDQQFFVRHAYFLGADDPYEKLKRTLRADIDETAWASLNSTRGDRKPGFDHAARPWYSWMSPPSRSRRRTSRGLTWIGSAAAASGGVRPRARWGRPRLSCSA